MADELDLIASAILGARLASEEHYLIDGEYQYGAIRQRYWDIKNELTLFYQKEREEKREQQPNQPQGTTTAPRSGESISSRFTK